MVACENALALNPAVVVKIASKEINLGINFIMLPLVIIADDNISMFYLMRLHAAIM